jgi:hypothetical protein
MVNMQGEFAAISGRIASGWAIDLDHPDAAVPLVVLAGGVAIGEVVAVTPAAAPAPEGAKMFEFLLPASGYAAAEVEIAVHTAEGAMPLAGSPRLLRLAVQAEELLGSLDEVTSDGWVRGWACAKNRLAVRREVEIIAGTAVVGQAVADGYRQDLEKASIGDGRYAFAFALPFEVMAQPAEFLVAVRDVATGRPIGKPKLFQPKKVGDALAKVAALEADLALLRASMAAREAQARADTEAAAALFRTAGAFFLELAAAASAGLPASHLRNVRQAAAAVTADYPPLALDTGSAALSVCVVCHGGAAPAYATLQALAEDPAGLEIFVLDGGLGSEVPLLPLVVPGLAYMRGGADQVAALNQVLAVAAAPVVVFLSAGMRPQAGWAEAVLAGFNASPSAIALSAQLTDAAGTLRQAGISWQGEDWVPRGQSEDRAAFAIAAKVDAASLQAVALRRMPALALGGLPADFADPAMALLSFCHRASTSSFEIVYEPGFAVQLPASLELPALDVAARAADAARLRAALGGDKAAAA